MAARHKPTALKIITGNPGKRPLPEKEAKIPPSIPKPPKFLSGEAIVEWDRMCIELYNLGLLTFVDMAALGAYCQAYGRWADAETQLNASTLIIETTNGNLIQNPLVGIANKAMLNVVKLACEFGMTPAARAKVQAAPPDKTVKKTDEFFDE